MLNILGTIRGRERLYLLGAFVTIVVQVYFDLLLPDYMSEVTRLVQTEGTVLIDILGAGSAMLMCALGSLLFAVGTRFCIAKAAAGISESMRAEVFSKVVAFSSQDYNRFSPASLITRSTNDVAQVQRTITMGFTSLTRAPLTAIWAISKIMSASWQWTAATVTTVVILFVGILLNMGLVVPKFIQVQELTDDLSRVTRENLTGIQVIRAFNAEDSQSEKFEDVNSRLTSIQLFTGRVMSAMGPMMGFITSGLSLSIYWIGLVLISAASEYPVRLELFSEMIVFSSYAMQVIGSFMMLTMAFIMIPQAKVSIDRISEIIDSEPSIEDGPLPEQGKGRGSIEFRNVGFRYPDGEEYSVRGIDLKIEPGETVAFIGRTGSGKSTLINLIPRLFDVSEGSVLVDGVDVREYSQADLRDRIGFVPQRATLFQGTVASNVAFGQDEDAWSLADIDTALEVAQAKAFVDALESGVDSQVAQDGDNFSGGQRQRLTIARAVYSDPEIYIFDDSFSALDYATDRNLRHALAKHARGTTVLIVAQRIGTIMEADKIVVLEDGRIVDVGTHAELLARCDIYHEIAESQLTEEEIANAS
ncbi:MAG: ABC transporter ATP-binding protein [Atopobiaceae bacterium]|nr:ABC transporter ATP-binding protein [Atopobiaceae bacterium]